MSYAAVFDLTRALKHDQIVRHAQDFISRNIMRSDISEMLNREIDTYVRVLTDTSVLPAEKNGCREKLSEAIRRQLEGQDAFIAPGEMSIQMGLLDRTIKNAQKSPFIG